MALKVSADVAGETRALAQLQHTNIVSIYSVHRRGPLQAVCMPYLGATTLADTLSDLRSQAALPKSGDGLLSTLHSRRAAVAAPNSDLPESSAAKEDAEPGADKTRRLPHRTTDSAHRIRLSRPSSSDCVEWGTSRRFSG